MSEPNTPNTEANVDAGLQTIIAREVIYANAQYMAWHGIALEKQADGEGTGVTFPVLSALAVAEDTLPADSNPASAAMADTTAAVTILEKGNILDLQQRLSRSSKYDAFQAAAQLLSVNMAESVDAIAGGVAIAGSNLRRIAGRAADTDLLVADVITRAELVRAAVQLKSQRAPKHDDGFYRCVLNPYMVGDLFATGANLGDFVDVSKYSTPESLLTGEIGRLAGFSFIEASQKNVATNGAGEAVGANTVGDRVMALCCGKGYVGYAWALQPFVRIKMEASDRMERFVVMYWKGEFGYGRIREANAIRLAGRSAYAPNP